MIAMGRVTESDDDEISYSYYVATVPADQEAAKPYNRAECSKGVFANTVRVYRRHHIQKLTQMVAKAVGADPQGRIAKLAGTLVWRMIQVRSGGLAALAPARAAA